MVFSLRAALGLVITVLSLGAVLSLKHTVAILLVDSHRLVFELVLTVVTPTVVILREMIFLVILNYKVALLTMGVVLGPRHPSVVLAEVLLVGSKLLLVLIAPLLLSGLNSMATKPVRSGDK